jgi:PAS domain-containing protein
MPPLPDADPAIRDLDALFDQSPIALVFSDRELRTRRTNAAFRRLIGLPVMRKPSWPGACTRSWRCR